MIEDISPVTNLSELLHECMRRDITAHVFVYPSDRYRTAHLEVRFEDRGKYICNDATSQGDEADCFDGKYRLLVPSDIGELIDRCLLRINAYLAAKRERENKATSGFKLEAD